MICTPSEGTSKKRSPLGTVALATSITGEAKISFLLTTAPCVRLLFITMNMAGLFMNFFLRTQMCNVGNVNLGPCQPSLTSTSQPNSLPLPFTKRSIPKSSGFSMHSYPNWIQNLVADSLAGASNNSHCSYSNCLSTKSLLIFQVSAVPASKPLTGVEGFRSVTALFV